MQLKVIAHIHNDFADKFGVPRQSGLIDSVESLIVFEPEYRNTDALRGIEGFSHLWLIWQFSLAVRDEWSPTVRPPRLGGNKRMGVFATRSPFRPNSLGLSSVRLLGTEHTDRWGTALRVAGADMMNGTPIFDIKPYLAYTDSHPEALGGFTDSVMRAKLTVNVDESIASDLPPSDLRTICDILSEDPRPSYIDDPSRVYGMRYGRYEVKFTVDNNILTVTGIERAN